MSKRILLVPLLLCILFSLFAQDISMEGIGATLEDAKVNAKENLSRYINGEYFSTKTSVSISETQRSGGASTSSSSFFSESGSVSLGFLRAVEFVDEKKDGDGYRITAVIRDSSTNIASLVSEMNDLSITITSQYSSLVGKNNQTKKGLLVSLYGYLYDYECCKRTLIYLGHADIVPDLGLMITSASILTDYQNIVLSEGYRLEELEQSITDEAEKKKLQDALYENRQEQRRLEREKSEEIAAREEASRNMLIQKLNQVQNLVSNNTPSMATSDFEVLLEDALRLRSVFLNACIQCDEIIADEFADIDRDLYAEARAVAERPYRLAELKSDGTPLEQVYSVREDEIDYLYVASLMHKAEVFKTIRASLFNSIKEKYDDYERVINKLNNSFEMPIGTKKAFNVEYDSVNYNWIVTVDLHFDLYSETKIQFVLSYEELTGKRIQSAKFRGQPGYEEYMQFLDEIDFIDTLMRSFGDYFDVSLSFKANVLLNDASKIGFSSISYSKLKVHITSYAINENKAFKKEVTPDSTSCTSNNLFLCEMPKYLTIIDIEGLSFIEKGAKR